MIVEMFQLSFHVFVCAFCLDISSFFSAFPLCFPIVCVIRISVFSIAFVSNGVVDVLP